MFRTSDLLADFERLTRGLNLGADLDKVVDDLSTTFSGAGGVDAVRTADRFELYIDLPGVDPSAVDVTVDGRDLTVAASRTFAIADDAEVVARGRRHGDFRRTFRLRDDLDTERLSAHYEHGVLTLTVPVSASAQPRKIEVTAAETDA